MLRLWWRNRAENTGLLHLAKKIICINIDINVRLVLTQGLAARRRCVYVFGIFCLFFFSSFSWRNIIIGPNTKNLLINQQLLHCHGDSMIHLLPFLCFFLTPGIDVFSHVTDWCWRHNPINTTCGASVRDFRDFALSLLFESDGSLCFTVFIH